ncbi:MAG: J domain-containing protein [Clostridiaceae bacterium]|nr:J domain-containing protein [Clostridiaceae bacterium]
MSNNPYMVLGVSPESTEEEVRAAYRELVRKYHPDQYEDPRAKELAEAKMREINVAYDEITLGNQQHATRTGWGQQSASQSPPYGQPYNSPNQSPYYRSSGSGGSCCQTLSCLCCADSCCECMGGDLCLCC